MAQVTKNALRFDLGLNIASTKQRASLFKRAAIVASFTIVAGCFESDSNDAPALRVGDTPPLVTSTAPSQSNTSSQGSAPSQGNAPPLVNATASVVDFPETEENAARFLVQSTFGPTEAEITRIENMGYSSWIKSQAETSPSFFTPRVVARQQADPDGKQFNAASDFFWEAAVSGRDQLRQRMVYALSQVLVVSESTGSPIQFRVGALSYYMDILSRNALGNYRDLLEEVTYSPAMGLWLTYLANEKANPDTGSVPDENYAREIMQLFTIGLIELNPDGTPVDGAAETYTNEDVIGLARVFTGLGYKGNRRWLNAADDDALYSPMQVYPEFHSPEEKSFLGTTIPPGTSAEESISTALDTLVNHPNTPTFVGKQLIQRMITSNPSPAYVTRVATAFADGRFRLPDGTEVGDGRRGDLLATASAVILDPEARQDTNMTISSFGKVREPVLRFTHWARAFNVKSANAQEERWLQSMSGSDRIGQHPFRAPSVFNFFRPGFVAPGTATANADLVAPELQIENEASIVGFANTMGRFIRDNTPNSSGASGDAFSPRYDVELELSEDVDALINRLDLLLTYGRLEQSTKDRIKTVLEAMVIRENRAESDRLDRVRTAIMMVVTSPEYTVQS
ncbi:MAG: DUF1800 domain-containing protein [Pseudomonadota bacterium]